MEYILYIWIMSIYLKYIITLLICVSSNRVMPQSEVASLQQYDRFIGRENCALYNGKIYTNQFLFYENSHIYYAANRFVRGSVFYGGQVYFGHFKYDILNDALITQYSDKNRTVNVILNAGSISKFVIEDKVFTKIPHSISLHSIYANGFFEEVYKGEHIMLYIKHTKKKVKKILDKTVKYKLSEKSVFIIKYKDNFHSISKKKHLFKLFPNLKAEIGAYLGKNEELNKETLYNLVSKIAVLLEE